MHDVEVLGRVRSSEYMIVRATIHLNLKRECVNLVKKQQTNLEAVRKKADQYRLVLPNQCAALEHRDEYHKEVMNETVTRLASEAAIEVGAKAPRQPVGKFSQVTKDLIK
ncbi:MAG TPA: hypothetical protein ACHBX0_09350 [Arsenophonus sp.]